MPGPYSVRGVVRGASVVAVVLMTAALVALLWRPGFTGARLAEITALVAAVGAVGAVGAYRDSAVPMATSAVCLFVLGVWQFTIGLAVLPTALVLAVGAVLSEEASEREEFLSMEPW